MAKFKKGDKCIVTKDCEDGCYKKGDIVVVDEDYSKYPWCKRENGALVVVNQHHLKLYKSTEVEKRLAAMRYSVGDVLVDSDSSGDEIIILAVVGLVYISSLRNNFERAGLYNYTQEELDDSDYKLKEEEPQPTEVDLSVEEVEQMYQELKGDKVKINIINKNK